MDPLTPAPPRPAYFDRGPRAWVLSRYADILAALREPALRQEAGNAQDKQPHARAQVQAAVSPAKQAQWQHAIETSAHEIIASLPVGRQVDLVRDVIRPWTLEIAISALPDGPAHRRRLLRLARDRAAHSKSPLRAKLANAEFKFFFGGRPGDKSTFIGISETLPAFLANAWVALLRHPLELARLRAQPELLPAAIEELLRYAGLVHSLIRKAASDVDLAGARISGGDRVILKLASANRDPEQFPDPDRLNLARRPAGHLSLGHGEHSCVGAMLLRAASCALTRAFAENLAEAKIQGEIEWRWGDTLVSPEALPVVLISH